MKTRINHVLEDAVKRGIKIAYEQHHVAAVGMMMKAGLSIPTITRVLFHPDTIRVTDRVPDRVTDKETIGMDKVKLS